MKVLHIISGGEVGGSKKHLLTLVRGMDENRCRNIIVCFIKGKLYEEAKELGIDIRYVEQRKRFDLSAVSRIRDLCVDEKIDIVNCHGGRANFIGYFLKRKYPAKYISTIHSDYRDDYRGNKYKTLVYSNINRMVLNSFDYFITVSQSFKEMLKSRGFDEDKIFVVYNGIDFDRKVPAMSREKIIEKYGLDDVGHYVSIIGRLHRVKGHRVFLEACADVIKEVEDVRFILIGDGELREELEKYTAELGLGEYVKFAGWQVPDELLYISDFTVMASYTESFPLVILEGAFYKKTVVSTDVGGVSMLVEDGVNGCLVNPGDSLAMAQRILELLLDEEGTKELGNRLYIKARDKFSIKNLVESYLNAYEEIIDGGK